MNRKALILIAIICISALNCGAQDSLTVQHFQHIVKLISQDSISELAQLINYPLARPNPLPNISTGDEFISYSPILFDSSFRRKLSEYNDSDIFEHNGLYGLVGGKFWGEIWINDEGKIERINYRSDKEIELQKSLTSKIQNQIYPAVRSWKENILVCETDKYQIRVDLLENNDLRYTTWNKPKKINEKPDIILYNGVQEFQGTMGGVTYTFKNNGYYYQVDEVDMAETDDQLGLFLRIFKNKNDLKNYKAFISFKCHEIK